MAIDEFTPKLLASSGLKFFCSISDTKVREDKDRLERGDRIDNAENGETNYFKSMQWYSHADS